jgi:hypothetical protein
MRKGHMMTSLLIASLAIGCQSPTDPDDTVNFDDVVDVTSSPNPIIADTLTGGRTYRVVRGNNQPDDILPYDWHAVFTTTITFNDQANDDDVDIDFPARISATTVTAKQASGGIITPPTGSDTEKSEFVVVSASGSQVTAVNSPVTMTFEVWYDLPSLRKEAVMTVVFSFVDDEGGSFQKSVDLTVSP